jgi:hypothetical protein
LDLPLPLGLRPARGAAEIGHAAGSRPACRTTSQAFPPDRRVSAGGQEGSVRFLSAPPTGRACLEFNPSGDPAALRPQKNTRGDANTRVNGLDTNPDIRDMLTVLEALR